MVPNDLKHQMGAVVEAIQKIVNKLHNPGPSQVSPISQTSDLYFIDWMIQNRLDRKVNYRDLNIYLLHIYYSIMMYFVSKVKFYVSQNLYFIHLNKVLPICTPYINQQTLQIWWQICISIWPIHLLSQWPIRLPSQWPTPRWVAILGKINSDPSPSLTNLV